MYEEKIMRPCHVAKLLSVIFSVLLLLALVPVHAEATQPGCKQVCAKTDLKCVQTEKKCVRTKQECAQTGKKCVATKTHCLQRNAKTGQCTSSQEVCTQYEEYCAQYRQACAQYEDVCTKKQEVCAQYQEVCPSTSTASGSANKPKGKMPCNECVVQRSRCTTGCGNIDNLIKQSDCINRCNGAYSCIMGYDCQ